MASSKDTSPKKPIDWERYGLSPEIPSERGALLGDWSEPDDSFQFRQQHAKELFHEDQSSRSKPWWKTNFFLSEPVLFGVWDGVFTSCMINLFSVIVFLRIGWIVGNAGVGETLAIVLTTVCICTTTVLAGIGICERCHVGSGGVHFLLSHVLGARTGGAISLIYCFGQCVSCALHAMGFAESFSQIVSITNPWAVRGIAVLVITFLLGINLAGVKWVVRLQFGLLIILLLAALDFAVGTFVQVDIAHGVIGYDWDNFQNNTGPDYTDGENWFTVFGVFFPAMTGILAGINMSGDLSRPSTDIPMGTLASVGTSLFIYMMFVIGLGATCRRWALQTDFLIAEKVSAIGVLLLAGLYISAMSTCLGASYATPRIIQSMANANVIPVMRFLGHGNLFSDCCTHSEVEWANIRMWRPHKLVHLYHPTARMHMTEMFSNNKKGPNKVPVYSLVLFATVTFIFVLIGSINTLAPIVTIPFLLTYASVEYAYFSLAMTFDLQKQREEKFHEQGLQSPSFDVSKASVAGRIVSYGSTKDSKVSEDLDQLFPERVPHHKRGMVRDSSSLTVSRTESPVTSPDEHSSIRSADSGVLHDKEKLSASDAMKDQGHLNWYEIGRKQKRWYTIFSNRWIALLGASIKITMMFLVQWTYALSAFVIIIVVWFYIGQANPGTFRGIAEFQLFPWMKNVMVRCLGCKPTDYDQIVVAPVHPGVEVTASQLTQDNVDYASRERYHHSKAIDNISPTHHPDSD